MSTDDNATELRSMTEILILLMRLEPDRRRAFVAILLAIVRAEVEYGRPKTVEDEGRTSPWMHTLVDRLIVTLAKEGRDD